MVIQFSAFFRRSAEHVFEVRHINTLRDKFAVDIEKKECSCREWMPTGIPCSHAISCLNNMNINPEEYIPIYYRRQMYEIVYGSIIYPANGQNVWVKTPYDDVLPHQSKSNLGGIRRIGGRMMMKLMNRGHKGQ